MQLPPKKRPFKTWIEISREILLSNLEVFKKIAGDKTSIYCVVKANAYGHGMEEVVEILAKEDIRGFAVDNLSEALVIRSLDIDKEVLVLGYTPLQEIEEAVANGISLTVYSKKALKKIVSIKPEKRAKVHIKVETGLNRQGLGASQVLELSKYIKKHNKYLKLAGVSTHFANIEDTLDSSFAFSQLENFKSAIKKLKDNGIKVPVEHTAASAATLLYPETHFSAVRVGISLYGLWPSKETRIALSLRKKNTPELKPVLTWKSIIAQVKSIDAGDSVGYGRAWFAPRRSTIAVVPVGYSDGYDRKLSNNSRVIVGESYAPLVGRVAMNMIILDVTNSGKVSPEEEVILLGKRDDKEITADEISEKTGTINYEIVSRINPLLPRVVV